MREFGPHPSTVADLDFSKDGSRIACAHYGGVTVWSIGQVTLPPRRFAWRGSHVALRWSTDGKFIATGTQENDIHVWRMAQATDMRMQGYPAKVKSLSWTADARFLYTSAQPVFTAWSFSGKGPEGKPPLQFGEEGAGLLAVVAAHPTAEFVAGGYDSGELQLGDIKTRRSVVLKMADGSAITCLAWSPDGFRLAVGNEGGALLVIDLRRQWGRVTQSARSSWAESREDAAHCVGSVERTHHEFRQDTANIRRHREVDGVVQPVGGQPGPRPMDPAARDARRRDDREAGMAMIGAVALVGAQPPAELTHDDEHDPVHPVVQVGGTRPALATIAPPD